MGMGWCDSWRDSASGIEAPSLVASIPPEGEGERERGGDAVTTVIVKPHRRLQRAVPVLLGGAPGARGSWARRLRAVFDLFAPWALRQAIGGLVHLGTAASRS